MRRSRSQWWPLLCGNVTAITAIIYSVFLAVAVISGVAGTPANAATTVTLTPANDLQTAVNANPAGTTFILSPGTYRAMSVTYPKNNDTFMALTPRTVILDGTNILSGWTQVTIGGTTYWTTAGGAPLEGDFCGSSGSCCMNGWSDCTRVQNLYFDNQDYGHASSLANLKTGRWYYDYSGNDGGVRNNIYLLDNPGGHTVELSAQNYAFNALGGNPASNVTIKNLIIEKYGTPIERGAVQVTGPNWVIDSNEIRLNHGEGLVAHANNTTVTHNYAHDNGELGIGGGGTDRAGNLFTGDLFDSNKVVHNNIDNVTVGFEAGGMKSVMSNARFTNNIVHDNYGPGIWFDVHSDHITIDHNTSYNNTIGISYEISHTGTITNNTVYGNGWSGHGQDQIDCRSCDYTTISGNTVTVGVAGPWSQGMGGIEISNGRTDGFTVTHNQVTNNTITIVPGSPSYAEAGGLADYALSTKGAPQSGIFTDPTNYFDYNTYYAPSLSGSYWFWGENSSNQGPNKLDWSHWQTAGQDRHGSLVQKLASLPPNTTIASATSQSDVR